LQVVLDKVQRHFPAELFSMVSQLCLLFVTLFRDEELEFSEEEVLQDAGAKDLDRQILFYPLLCADNYLDSASECIFQLHLLQ